MTSATPRLRGSIVEREPETFTELDELVAASGRLGPVIAGLDGIALAFSTEGRRPAQVADEMRDAFAAELRPERDRTPRRPRRRAGSTVLRHGGILASMATGNEELVRSSFDA